VTFFSIKIALSTRYTIQILIFYCLWLYRLRARRHPVTSLAPGAAGYYSGAVVPQLKLTSYVTSRAPCAAGCYSGAVVPQLKLTSYNHAMNSSAAAESLTDRDYCKSWRHNVTSRDDVNGSSPAPGVYHYDDDADDRQYAEHIYESPKFVKKSFSWSEACRRVRAVEWAVWPPPDSLSCLSQTSRNRK